MARFTIDTLTSLVANLGTGRDKAATTFFSSNLLSDEQIRNAYDYAWLPRKIVDIPAFDSVRAWRDWQASAAQIEAIEAEEKRLGLQAKVLEAKIQARLWGGSAILIGTGEADLSRPLDPARIGKGGLKYLTVLSCLELAAGEIDNDPASDGFGRPRCYRLSTCGGAQLDIHASRLAVFRGARKADRNLSASLRQGWDDSVLQSIIDAIKQADGTAANIASLVFEAKVDIIRIPNFMQNVGDRGYRDKLMQRYALANTAKGVNGTLLLDKEEEYDSKTAAFGALPDVLDRFLQIVSGAADIPATRLLGQSPAGLNASGDSDTRNYYDRLCAMQAIEMTPALYRLDEGLIRSALGARPKAVHYLWAPLWSLSETEKAEVFKTKAEAARTIAGAGSALIPPEALSEALINEMVEDGALAGLEAAMAKWQVAMAEAPEPEPSAPETTEIPTQPDATTGV